MAWYKVADAFDLSKPFIRKVSAGGKSICLVNADKVYAVSSKCPHAGADLSGGWCKNGKLICPFHRYAYDLETGKGAPGQNDFINVYSVEIKDDGVYVQVTSWLERLTGKK
ncbi:Rieske (2Fe-2S) protein [Mucilaginibacter aquatilis]|uniref:Rieske 2Fe-2S domain-containing protein n=1 Tax=Mucilaginibacter aquatilis TaxID=1517760 RepID=A0A6I4I8T4_9SPHI|nr:Rieske 2Fe-2S domain-containing protein [Mucilaginibacter aquatilis]MVN91327.1 Rieske 2Fe-2S domain-containing protein [Mucilaginibacter aquatilis]